MDIEGEIVSIITEHDSCFLTIEVKPIDIYELCFNPLYKKVKIQIK